MELRPYQKQLLEDTGAALDEGHRSVLVVLPTGGGKTVCFSSIAQQYYEAGLGLWAVAHREELVDQMSEKFHEFGVNHGIIKSGMPLVPHPVQAGMIQTLRNKMHRLNAPNMLIVDEAHHMPAAQYDQVFNSVPADTFILGFTATAHRLDGKGLGKYFSKIVQGPSISELISMGYLVPPKVFAPSLIDPSGVSVKFGDYDRKQIAALLDDPAIIGDCIEHYQHLAPNTQAVAFCISVAKAEEAAKGFRDAGIPALSIDGSMAKPLRKRILDDFREKRIRVLCSADLISEGFDCPGIETAILLRPTKSESLYLQQVGRALRTAPGKECAIILDHVQNTLQHGLPTMDRYWSLDGRQKRTRNVDPDDIKTRTCPVCYICYTGNMCPLCKIEELGGSSRQVNEYKGILVEVQTQRNWLTKEEIEEALSFGSKIELDMFCKLKGFSFEKVRKILVASAHDLETLRRVGKVLSYQPNWSEKMAIARNYIEDPDQQKIILPPSEVPPQEVQP